MRLSRAVMAGLLVLLAAGCASTGGNQVENTVYDIHRIVKGQNDSVAKLNQTAADLTTRLNDSDQQARALESMLEENRVKLEGLQRTVDNLAATLHRSLNLSPPTAGASAYPGSGEAGLGGPVTVTPPPAGAVTAPPPAISPITTPPPATATAPANSPLPAASGSPEADYKRAQESYKNGDFAGASQQYDAFLQRYPNHELCAPAQFWKGYALFNMGRFEESVAELGKVRTKYPDSDRVSYAMYIEAMAHKGLGQTARADALLKEIVEKFPNTPAWEKAKGELSKSGGN